MRDRVLPRVPIALANYGASLQLQTKYGILLPEFFTIKSIQQRMMQQFTYTLEGVAAKFTRHDHLNTCI